MLGSKDYHVDLLAYFSFPLFLVRPCCRFPHLPVSPLQVVLGTGDVEELVSELSEIAEWEYNLRMIKAKGREAEKLPSTIKVEKEMSVKRV